MSGRAIARIREIGLIPVIRAESDDHAVQIADALAAAGLAVIEITMTVPHAVRAMTSVAKRLGSAAVLGAGTVTTPEMADAAIDAGCEFLVTPCLLPAVITRAHERRVPILAGALTPTEIFAAHQAGADLVKVFPANAAGGPSYLRALKGPFPDIEVVPTGGVSLQTVGEYIRAGAAAVGVGGELIQREWVAAGDFRAIGALGQKFVEAIRIARRTP